MRNAGTLLKLIRTRNYLSQADVSMMTGYSQPYIGQLESGRMRVKRHVLETILRSMRMYKIEVEQITALLGD